MKQVEIKRSVPVNIRRFCTNDKCRVGSYWQTESKAPHCPACRKEGGLL